MKTAVIGVSDWEMQCCGDPFEVGDSVSWTISELKSVFPEVMPKDVDYYYDNHYSGDIIYIVNGIVTKIEAVYVLYEPVENRNVPVATRVELFEGKADGWTQHKDEYKFWAYLAHLEYESDMLVYWKKGS